MKRVVLHLSFILCIFALFLRAQAFADNFALETGSDAFFRTVQTTDQISAIDGSFTIELWFKGTGAGVLINEVDAYDVSYWDHSLAEVTDSGRVLIGLPGVDGVADIGGISFGSWNHLAIRYDAGTGAYEGFLNGVAGANSLSGVRQMPSVPNPVGPPTARVAYIAFGRNAQTPLVSGGWFSGDFDEVRTWSAARSDQQIKDFMQVSDPPIEDSLQSFFHLDEGAGSTLGDASGHNHPGVDVGATWVPSTLSLNGLPVLVSVSATVQSNSVNVSATIDPAKSATEAYVEYGETTDYEFATDRTLITVPNGEVEVNFTLTNLTLGIYHYRLVATNEFGATIGSDTSFALTNNSGFSARTTGTNYFRSTKITRPFFTDASLTVEFWFKAFSPGVLLNEVDSLNVTRWDYSLLEILDDGSLVAGLPNVPTVSAGKVEFGKWYHVAYRYDPTISNLDVFLNGVKVATTHGSRSVPWDYSSTVYLAFGRGGPDNLGGGAFLDGRFDEVRIWRTPLPDAELSFIWKLILSGVQSDLFAYWNFDNISNDIAPDISSNHDPAQFVNGSEPDISDLSLELDLRPSAGIGNITDSIGTTAVVSGTAYSQDTNTIAYFVWTQGSVTNQTTNISVTGQTNNAVRATLGGLEGGITYSVWLVVSNAAGTVITPPINFLKMGWAGYSLSLGTNAYVRTIADQHPFFPNESITAEIWLKPHKHGVVMSETDRFSSSSLDVSLIEILADGTVVAGFPGLSTITLGTVNFEEWNSIILRYSKTALKMDGFVNGIKSAASGSGDRQAGWETGHTIIHTFGKSTLTKIGTGESLPAEWDEIRLWNTARTDADILAQFNRKIPGTDTNLVAYWRFDDRLTTITDSSGHTNRGQIVGITQFVTSGAPISVDTTPVKISSDGTVTVQYAGSTNATYRVESTTDFQSWTAGPTTTTDNLGIASFNVGNVSDSAARFFRFKQL